MDAAEYDLKAALRKALALEKRGKYPEAIGQYELVVATAGEGHASAAMARERIVQLQGKL